jgi:hypothetical protein
MLGAGLLLLSLQTAAEPPRTVNDAVLGPAESFTTPGPATVCMRQLVIRPRTGQRVQLLYSGIHAGTLRLYLEDGRYVDFMDGEIFVDRRQRGEAPVAARPDMKIFLTMDQRPKVNYQLEGTGQRTKDYAPPRVMASGPGLASDTIDDRIFDEVQFTDPAAVKCDRRYEYGWGVLMDGEPFDIRSDHTGDGDNS